MAAIIIKDVAKSFDGQLVLDGLSLSLHKGEKVGLIGANGSGKTTLFKLIMGIESPDAGTITKQKSLTAAYLPQEPRLREDAALIDIAGESFERHRRIEAELQDLSKRIGDSGAHAEQADLMKAYDRLHAEFEAAGGYNYEIRLREVLGGLGFAPEEYRQSVRTLSGGQKCRVALARMLLTGADFLLLDEPTNHLDIDATRWLEKFLAGHRGGAVLISHDRYLLDRVATKIIEIDDHRATVYPTDYSGYAEAKRIRQLHAVREYEKQSEWIAHQRDYIQRVGARKDSAKQARSRKKLLDNMQRRGRILKRPKKASSGIKLKFDSQDRGGDMVVRCEGARKGFGDLRLIKDLDFEMTRGEKVGIIGPNGVGKTTLLRMLLGQTEPDAGVVRLFETLTVGYYDQEHRDLDPSLTVIEAVRQAHPEAAESEARSYLALFLFRGDDVFKKVGDLSGGEQSRVLLARLVWTHPQVLVLDEPTNHLDIPAREALEEALKLYGGSILMVSHDRYFLDRVADRLLVMVAREQHEVFDGNWSEYARVLAEREEAARIAAEQEKQARRDVQTAAQKSKTGRKKTKSKYAAKRIEDLEATIMEKEARIEAIETAFADPVQMKDQAFAAGLHTEYDGLRSELSELIARWEDAIEGHIDGPSKTP